MNSAPWNRRCRLDSTVLSGILAVMSEIQASARDSRAKGAAGGLPSHGARRMRLHVPALLAASIVAVAWAAAGSAAHPTFESDRPVSADTKIDTLILAKLGKAGIAPALCSDAVFVRRAYLDIIGILPTADEARAFILDPDVKNKRRLLIDRLLERPEFADYWAMRWSDILRIKAEFPVNLWPNAAQAYHRWVRASLAENKPYDRFVRELLTSSGSNFRVAPVNFYRAVQNRTPEGIAGAVALTFMGSRTDTWTSNQVAGLAAFFSQIGFKPTSEWKEENVFWDPIGASAVRANVAPGRDAIVLTNPPPPAGVLPTNRPPSVALFPDGTKVKLPADKDPREVFADWLISPKNGWFSKAIVNRVWYWLLGRGIIHEPDDIRPDNPPSHPELLAYLEKELVASRYDLKHIYRIILNSSVYQFSSLEKSKDPKAASLFASYPLRRLDAEVLIDAINDITGTTDLYTSPIPEPFTYIPEDMKAVQIADGSISSPFLTMFGRTARATGMENERDNRPMPAQWRHMLNSSHIQRKIETGPGLKPFFESKQASKEQLDRLYLTILSRFPTPEEIRTAEEHIGSGTAKPASAAVGPSAAGTGGATARSDDMMSTGGDMMEAAARSSDRPSSGAKAAAGTPSRGSGKAPLKGTYDRTAAKAAAKAEYAAKLAAAQRQREGWVDIAWSLVNSSEFLYRH